MGKKICCIKMRPHLTNWKTEKTESCKVSASPRCRQSGLRPMQCDNVPLFSIPLNHQNEESAAGLPSVAGEGAGVSSQEEVWSGGVDANLACKYNLFALITAAADLQCAAVVWPLPDCGLSCVFTSLITSCLLRLQSRLAPSSPTSPTWPA